MSLDPIDNIIGEIVKLSTDLMCIVDADGYFKWVNPAFEVSLGWSEKELLSNPVTTFIHPQDVAPTQDEVARLLANKKPSVDFVNRYKKKNGDFIWLQWRATPKPNGDIFAVARDITIQKLATDSKNEHLRFLELSEQFAQVGHWRVDFVQNQIFWSKEVYRIHGVDVDSYGPDLEGAINWYHPDDRDTVRKQIEQATETKGGFQFQLRIIRPDNEVRDVRSIGKCELDAAGNVCGIFGVFQDVTETAQQTRQLA